LRAAPGIADRPPLPCPEAPRSSTAPAKPVAGIAAGSVQLQNSALSAASGRGSSLKPSTFQGAAPNAGKYGALSTDSGRVDVSWGTDRNTLTMSWTERAGPPVSAPPRRGFGTIVMEARRSAAWTVKVDLDLRRQA
jgi:hypothetical protein